MPYLPPELLQDTEFPKAYGKDLATQIRMIDEQYKRMFPEVPYYCIKVNMTPVATGELSGEVGSSKIDTLYGEAMDPAAEAWTQPHLSGTLKAADPEVFDPPQTIHIKIQKADRELDLKKPGIVKVRRLAIVIPAYTLDLLGMTVHEGDKFTWHDDVYYVKKPDPVGWFKNTNVRLFVKADIETRPVGS